MTTGVQTLKGSFLPWNASVRFLLNASEMVLHLFTGPREQAVFQT